MQQSGKEIQVLNRFAADKQITAEQIFNEAQAFREQPFHTATRTFQSEAEVLAYRNSKRKEFEDRVSRGKNAVGSFIKYAEWEAGQKEFDRARSIWERVLLVDHANVVLWCRYAEMEIAHGFVNRARNVLERAAKLLPLYSQVWLKWILLEERLNNVDNARLVFEQYTHWDSSEDAWKAYISFELRHDNVNGARQVYEKFLVHYNKPDTYVRYAKFEMQRGEVALARKVYERAMQDLGVNEDILLQFSKFEELAENAVRARQLYQYGIQHLRSARLVDALAAFERRCGTSEALEQAVLTQRKVEYESQLAKDPSDLDAWFALCKQVEQVQVDLAQQQSRVAGYIATTELTLSAAARQELDQVYTNAVAHVPTEAGKFRRFLFLFVNWAVCCEILFQDSDSALKCLLQAVTLMDQHRLLEEYVYIYLCDLYVRRKELDKARKALGKCIGQGGSKVVYEKYIAMELSLGDVPRIRTLFQKLIDQNKQDVDIWLAFIRLETSLDETDRAKDIAQFALQNVEKVDAVYAELIGLYSDPIEKEMLYIQWLSKCMTKTVLQQYLSFSEKSGRVAEARNNTKSMLDGVTRDIREKEQAYKQAYDAKQEWPTVLKLHEAMLAAKTLKRDWLEVLIEFEKNKDSEAAAVLQKQRPQHVRTKVERGPDDYVDLDDLVFEQTVISSKLSAVLGKFKTKKRALEE